MKTYLATIKLKLKAQDIIDARLKFMYETCGTISMDDVELKEVCDDGENKNG